MNYLQNHAERTLPNITSVRFFLAVFVVIFHITLFCKNRGFVYFGDWAIFHKGHEAVYMFFSLSGFLIIRQLYIEKQLTNTISLKRFYLRRILRIFPLYYLILFVGFFYYRVALPHLGFEMENNYDFGSAIVLGVTFFANILITYSPGGIIEILWSIGIEEQFYLFVAPIVWVLSRKHIVPFLLIFTFLYFAIFASNIFPFLQRFRMYYYYFSLSGLFAILSLKTNSYRFPKFVQIFIIALVIVYFTTTWFSGFLSDWVYQGFSVILFTLFVAELTKMKISFLENRSLNYLGKISYGIYMYHTVVIQFVGFLYLKITKIQQFPILSTLLFNIMVIGGTILISHFSYKYYESYFLRKKN